MTAKELLSVCHSRFEKYMWYNILLRKESYCSAPGPGHSAERQLPKLACLLMRREAAVEKRCSTQHRTQTGLAAWLGAIDSPIPMQRGQLCLLGPCRHVPWRTTQMRCQQRNNICRENLCPDLPCVRPWLKPCMDRTTSFVCRMLDTAKVRCVLAVALLLDLY